MKKYIALLLVLLFAAFMLFPAEGEKYGQDITLKDHTKISEILEKPETFEGKKVLVEGTVVNVCEMRGCWIEISSDKEFETIRVKVNDGEIVFPMEAKGKKAVVEGEVYSIEIESKESCSHKEGEGESCQAAGEKKEGGCCAGKAEMSKVYQIKGLGAVIG